jgi:CheY-like chemotaxis protein
MKSDRIPNLTGTTVLIAEDEKNNYKLLEKILAKTEARLLWAVNGQKAIELIENEENLGRVIVLMDIKMPVINGIEASKKIKEINQYIPVIAVTAYAQVGDKSKLLEMGFDEYIPKPIEPDRLYKLLSYYSLHREGI